MKITLVVVGGPHAGKEIRVHRAKYTIGRSNDCQLRLESNIVSRHHCAIESKNERVIVEDLGSSDGTFVNGKKISAIEPQELKHGDHLAVGAMEFEVHIAGAIGGTQTESSATQKAADTAPTTPAPDSAAQRQSKAKSSSASAAAEALGTMNRFLGRRK